MSKLQTKKHMAFLLICGIIGCILMGSGDWLMIFGDPSYTGKLAWLTNGAAQIAPWRNTLAMVLSFPAVILYCIALLGLSRFFYRSSDRSVYVLLTSLGMTPWLCLHLFYIMILYLFAWMQKNGYPDAAFPACEALFGHFSWVIIVSEAMMILPFCYLFYLIIKGKTQLPKGLAFANPLLVYVILKGITSFLPNAPYKIAWINGLMSESMIICFVLILFIGIPAMKQQDENPNPSV